MTTPHLAIVDLANNLRKYLQREYKPFNVHEVNKRVAAIGKDPIPENYAEMFLKIAELDWKAQKR